MSRPNPEVDECFRTTEKWQEELRALRKIALGGPLTEELKWGKPVYTFQGRNVLIFWQFKDHCALGFLKGALLKDEHGILSRIGRNTQASRKVRFTDVREVVELESVLKAYIEEAVEVEKAGLEVRYKETSEFEVPEEVRNKLDGSPNLKAAFEALTPGRQRGYLLYFAAPKQVQTRVARVEKCRQRILAGMGLNDRPVRSRG